jgi:hypothetical protein
VDMIAQSVLWVLFLLPFTRTALYRRFFGFSGYAVVLVSNTSMMIVSVHPIRFLRFLYRLLNKILRH